MKTEGKNIPPSFPTPRPPSPEQARSAHQTPGKKKNSPNLSEYYVLFRCSRHGPGYNCTYSSLEVPEGALPGRFLG